MNKILMTALTLGLTVTGINLSHAQERAAAGAMETQMTWTSLNNLVADAKAKVVAVNSRVDQIVTCNKKSMAYAPGNGADVDGCIENAKILELQTKLIQQETKTTTIATCGNSGQLYNGTGCKAIPSPTVGKSNCEWVNYTTGNHDVVCPGNKMQSGIRYESSVYTKVLDNSIGPEVPAILCCSISN